MGLVYTLGTGREGVGWTPAGYVDQGAGGWGPFFQVVRKYLGQKTDPRFGFYTYATIKTYHQGMALSLVQLRKRLAYNPKTGVFIWRLDGRRAGYIEKEGYRYIEFDGRAYRAGRLAWFYVYGVWPTQVDHKNCVKSDDSIGNLREATYAQQMANRTVLVTNEAGIKGIRRQGNRWRARIDHNHRQLHLGYFSTPEEAAQAYKQAAEKLHGKFART